MTTTPKRPIGFPVVLAGQCDDGREGELIGLPGIRHTKSGANLSVKAGIDCPFCYADLYEVPQGVIIGRIVGVEGGKVAVDPLPEDVRPVACVPCGVTFYEREDLT